MWGLGWGAWARGLGPGPRGLGRGAWAWARGPGPGGLGQEAWAGGPGPGGLGRGGPKGVMFCRMQGAGACGA